jgi:hypothetical protein
MLLFTAPPAGPDGQPILQGLTAFPDHLGGHIVYYLPAALELLLTSSDDPDFFLLRYHGDFAEVQGGLLRFRLGFSPLSSEIQQAAADTGLALRPVYFPQGRFRLRLRSLQEGEPDGLSDWKSLVPAGSELAAPVVSLSPRETKFLEVLLEDSGNAVEVEVELLYSGLVPGWPWLVSVNTLALQQFLAGLLPETVNRDQIIAAFLSLPGGDADPFTFQPLEYGASLPEHDALRAEIALRSLSSLFEPQPRIDDFTSTNYRLRDSNPTDPPSLSWDLLPPRQETHGWTMNWEVGPLVASLDTPEERRKLFPMVSQVSPFAEIEVHVLNRVPYDPHYLQKTVVDLRYTGPRGVPAYRSFTFDGSVEWQSFSTFYLAAAGDFEMAARFTSFLSQPDGKGGPVVQTGEYAPVDGVVVEIDRAALGMDFVRVEAQPGVFDKAASIEVILLSSDPATPPTEPVTPVAEISLTADNLAAWVALPEVDPASDLYVRVIAHGYESPEVSSVRLRQDKILNRRARIDAYELEVLDPERITLALDPNIANRFALVQITVAPLVGEGRRFILRLDEPITWNFFRQSIFSPVRYRYCLDYIAIDAQGHSAPIASTGWFETDETNLVVRPPLQDSDVPL